MKIGTARVDITPEYPVWLDGFGSRDKPSAGTYLPLAARAILIEDGDRRAAIVSTEVLGHGYEQAARLRERMAREFGTPASEVILCASHTHCGPRVADLVMPGKVDEEYLARYEACLADLARAASASLRRASGERVWVAFSRAKSSFGVSRRLPDDKGGVRFAANPEGRKDDDLDTIWFSSAGGATLASLSVCGTHATSRGGYLVGGDYPGFLMRRIEERRGGLAAFAAGCAGDVRPDFLDAEGKFREAEIIEVALVGGRMADEAIAVGEGAEAVEPLHLKTAGMAVSLPLCPAPSKDELARVRDSDPNPLMKEWARRQLERLEKGSLSDSVPFEIRAVAFSPRHAALFLSGEVVSAYALSLKAQYPGKRLSVAAYSNGIQGYIPGKEMFPQGGYEVRGSFFYYDLPAPYRETVEDLVMDGCKKVLEQVW